MHASRSLQAQFIFPVSMLVAGSVLVLVIVISLSTRQRIEADAQQESRENVAHIDRILTVTDAIMMERVRSSMRLLVERSRALGAPRRGVPSEVRGQRVPELYFGKHAQAERFELVDGVTASQGGTATLFSRSGDDFVRIATNVRIDGQRAVGTRLDPDGRAIKAIRMGHAFYGQVDILGTPYLTGYEPMHDAAGELIGIWYVGYKVDMQPLQEAIAKSRVLARGFVALIDDKDKLRFHSDNVSPDTVRDAIAGNRNWSLTRAEFSPWGFTIIAAYTREEVGSAVSQDILQVVLVGVALCLLLIGLLNWLARTLVIVPLNDAIDVARTIARGDLTHSISSQRQDEIGILLTTLNDMREALQRLDRMKTDFLSSVSHELRTPLTSIRGFTSLIEREFSRHFAPLAETDDKLRKKSGRITENLGIILKESERLTRLINDVLDLAKIEAGRIEWHDTSIQPATLLRDSADALAGMFAGKSGVALRQDIANDLPPLFGDADRLQQVLINLLNNAAKFTERGEVVLAAFMNANACVQIEVRDSGCGFPPSEAEKIFDKFQQSSQGDTLTDKPKGTGLGLSIAKEIIERHGGRIWAASEPGAGSVFSIELPLSHPEKSTVVRRL